MLGGLAPDAHSVRIGMTALPRRESRPQLCRAPAVGMISAAAENHAPMIVVHHLENSRSQRVLWLLEELSLPYEVKRYERDPKTMLAPPELRRIHPLGKSP
ncbi:glutathione S-transferase, partial [Sphingomonas sp. LH128]